MLLRNKKWALRHFSTEGNGWLEDVNPVHGLQNYQRMWHEKTYCEVVGKCAGRVGRRKSSDEKKRGPVIVRYGNTRKHIVRLLENILVA